jgi:lipopolysaccharide assembly outer membrane protein LptD (OstA)
LKLISYIVLLICMLVLPCVAEDNRPSTRTSADYLRDSLVDGEYVTHLYGNVFIDRDTLTVKSDTAYFWRDKEEYEFVSNVHMTRFDSSLDCDEALYEVATGDAWFYGSVRTSDEDMIANANRGELFGENNLLYLIGNARVVSPEYVVWADTIKTIDGENRGEAFGNVKIVDPDASSVVTGDHALFSREEGFAEVDQSPYLVSREQGESELIATANLMRFFKENQRVVMIDSVRIRQDKSIAVADTAWINSREQMILRGSPFIDDGVGSTMYGTEIEFVYLNSEIDRIILKGDASVIDVAPDSLATIYNGLPASNKLSGDTITVYMKDGNPDRSVVIGNAQSIYVPGDNPDEIACNDVLGDTITIYFKNKKVNTVDVVGNMSGVYSFLSLDEQDPDSVQVTDFALAKEDVVYSGHQAEFKLGQRTILFDGDAVLDYGTMNLGAGHIRLDTNSRELYASESPLLIDGSQKIAGENMAYNFENKSSAVLDAVTMMEDYYYIGEKIKRFDNGDLKIKSGKMTSCDKSEPHYHFWSDKMKIRMKDKVFAQPVVIKIGKVPLFALPFYFKNMESGRKSGILFPSFDFGWSERTGRYIRDWGYYWAINDYTDATIRGDYNERREFTWRASNRYKKRYAFNGNLDYSNRMTLGDQDKSKQWQLNWNHNQDTLFDYYRFKASVKMSSNTLERSNLIRDVGQEVISGQQTSTMYISRNWSQVNASLNFKRDEFVNSEDELPTTDNKISTQNLPQLSLGFRSKTLLPALTGGRKGNLLGDVLRNTYFTHSYKFNSTKTNKELTANTKHSANGNASLSVKPPRLWIFSVNAGVSASHSWEREITEGTAYDDTLEAYDDVFERIEDTKPSLSMTSGMNTTLYGLFPVKIGKLRGIRHTFRFGVSHSLTPTIIDHQDRRESFSVSVGNRFDVKYATSSNDSTEQTAKMDGILDWSMNSRYNPLETNRSMWSNINSNVTIKPGNNRNLKVTMNNVFDPKEFAVVSTRLTYGLNLSGRLDTGAGSLVDQEQRNEAAALVVAEPDSMESIIDEDELFEQALDAQFDDNEENEDDFFAGFGAFSNNESGGKDATQGGRFLPWSMSSNLSYSRNHESDSITARASFNTKLTLSRNWNLSWRGSYDFTNGNMTSQSWKLQRELHCWNMEFARRVSSVNSEFGFIISLKAIPAVKWTRGKEDLVSSGGSGRGGLY